MGQPVSGLTPEQVQKVRDELERIHTEQMGEVTARIAARKAQFGVCLGLVPGQLRRVKMDMPSYVDGKLANLRPLIEGDIVIVLECHRLNCARFMTQHGIVEVTLAMLSERTTLEET